MKQALTFITFLLLLLPVWKDCSSQKSVPAACDIEVIDTLDVSCNEIDTVSINNRNLYDIDTIPKETAFDNFLKIFEWDKDCQSGYRQARQWLLIGRIKGKKSEVKNNENEIKNDVKNTKDEKNSIVKIFIDTFIITGLFYSFTIYLLISIALAVFSFTKKRKTFIWLSSINFFIIIWAYISYFCHSSDYYQIKFGFYLLIINSLMILLSNFLCKKR